MENLYCCTMYCMYYKCFIVIWQHFQSKEQHTNMHHVNCITQLSLSTTQMLQTLWALIFFFILCH